MRERFTLGDKILLYLSGMASMFWIWVGMSWLDVVAHNTTTYVYAWWNFFNLFHF